MGERRFHDRVNAAANRKYETRWRHTSGFDQAGSGRFFGGIIIGITCTLYANHWGGFLPSAEERRYVDNDINAVDAFSVV